MARGDRQARAELVVVYGTESYRRGRRQGTVLCSLAKLNGMVSRRGAVRDGRNDAVLWAGPTGILMAHHG